MGKASSRYDVLLNGQGYLLIEESYREKAQQPFNPRFSTGDNGLGDLSFWQFLGQTGWSSEGQESFETTTKYRQSAGFDMRGGKARLGYGIESVAIANALAAPFSSAAALLIDNFASGTIDWARWNDGYPGSNAGVIAAQAGAYGVRSGYHTTVVATAASARGGGGHLYAGGYGAQTQDSFGSNQGVSQVGAPSPISADPGAAAVLPARRATGSLITTDTWYEDVGSQSWTVLGGGGTVGEQTWIQRVRTSQLRQIGMTGLNISKVGTFTFDLYCRNSQDTVHAAVAFFLSTAGGGYVFQASGVGMTTWAIYRTNKANAWDNTGDTLVMSRTATSKINTKTTVTIAIDSSGVFTMSQDGGALGATATDTTYTSADCIRIVTGYASGGDTTVSNINVPTTAGTATAQAGKFIPYQNKLILAYDANGVADFTFTDTVAASRASNLPGITHLNVADACVWYRDADPTGGLNSVTGQSAFLVAVAGTTLNVYHGTTQVYTDGLAGEGALVVPVNATTLLVIGTSTAYSGIPFIQRFVFTVNTWTLSTEKIAHADGGVYGTIANSFAFDTNGMLYFATQDMSGTAGSVPSRVFRISATDLLATNPTFSAVSVLSNFMVRGVAAFNSSIYLLGAYLEGQNAYAGVMKFPGTQVYRSTKAIQAVGGTLGEMFNYGVASFWSSTNALRFLSNNDLDLWDPVLEMDSSENIREVASFETGQHETNNPNVLAICEWNGQFYCLNAQAGTIERTTKVRGGLGADHSTCVLELSEMGSNTPLINKTAYSVLVELSEAMPSGETMTVTLNGTTVGTMVTADGTRKEMVLSAELTGSAFAPKISLPQDSTWEGYVKGFLLKYVPTQFKKRSWGFGIRATRGLKLIDGTREQEAPLSLFSDIKTAWESNIPVTFVDIDGNSHSVIVTDYDRRIPLLDRRTDKQEQLCFVELLEC